MNTRIKTKCCFFINNLHSFSIPFLKKNTEKGFLAVSDTLTKIHDHYILRGHYALTLLSLQSLNFNLIRSSVLLCMFLSKKHKGNICNFQFMVVLRLEKPTFENIFKKNNSVILEKILTPSKETK